MNTNRRPFFSELLQQLEQSSPETDPERHGWRILLAAAWSVQPFGLVDALVDLAIRMSARPIDDVDRRVVEMVALEMMLAREDPRPA